MRIRFPLRLRLTLAFALGMAVVLAALGGFVYVRLGTEVLNGIDFQLRSRAGAIVSALNAHQPPPIDTGRRLIDASEAFAQVLDSTGGIVESTPAVARAPMLDRDTLDTIRGATFLSRRVRGADNPARLLVVPTAVEGGQKLVVIVGSTLADRNEALGRLLLLLAISGPAALALSSVAGWFLAGAALRPVERMRREAAAISESDVQARLAVPETDAQLARLAETLNALLERLQESVEREHRFVDDASHELRTPLATLKAELDLARARPRTAEELEATVGSAASQTDRLVRLAEDLLVLARTRGGRLPVKRVRVSLRDVLQEAVSGFRGRAEQVGGRIHVEAPDDPVRVDPTRIRQAIQNLLDNALRHGGATTITVIGAREPGVVRIRVEDDGPGFPPDLLLGGAFEPFVRQSASGDGDAGAGLGLSIVRAIAEAHGGHATVQNMEGGGARVTLDLGA